MLILLDDVFLMRSLHAFSYLLIGDRLLSRLTDKKNEINSRAAS